MAYWWNSYEELPEDVTDSTVLVEVNLDFGTAGLMAAELVAVVHAWQAGALSQESMLDLFKSEVLPEGRSNVEEAALIAGGQESLPVEPARGGGDRGGLQN